MKAYLWKIKAAFWIGAAIFFVFGLIPLKWFFCGFLLVLQEKEVGRIEVAALASLLLFALAGLCILLVIAITAIEISAPVSDEYSGEKSGDVHMEITNEAFERLHIKRPSRLLRPLYEYLIERFNEIDDRFISLERLLKGREQKSEKDEQ
jgi:hypothetical protein